MVVVSFDYCTYVDLIAAIIPRLNAYSLTLTKILHLDMVRRMLLEEKAENPKLTCVGFPMSKIM